MSDLVASLSREIVLVCDTTGVITWSDERAARLLDIQPGVTLQSLVPPGDEDKASRLLMEASTQATDSYELTLMARSTPTTFVFYGAPYDTKAMLVGNQAAEDYHAMLTQLNETMSELAVLQRESERQQRLLRIQQEERLQLLHREQVARARAELAEQRSRFLAEASEALVSSLDYQTTMTNVANLVVPYFADTCVGYVIEEGKLHQVAAAYADSSKADMERQLSAYPPNTHTNAGIGKMLRTGEPELIDISDTFLREIAHNDEHLALLQKLDYGSVIGVPLVIRGQTLGIITFANDRSGRYLNAADLDLAKELGRRIASAIDNTRLYREAKEAIRVRDIFLSIAAHELKTPLTSLLGNVQQLMRHAAHEGTLPPRDQRSLSVIGDQVSRLNEMITALLDISRIETGQLSIERAPMDLRALVYRIVEEIRPTLQRHTLELICPERVLFIRGDELRLGQVLQNLIGNAVKYSPQGGVVTVRVELHDKRISMLVTDQGLGIPAPALPHLFQRFYRAENVETQRIAGLGIGLYVVKEIVTLHDGTIEVESVEGQGSTFIVSLPMIERVVRHEQVSRS